MSRIIDISVTLRPGIPTWPGSPGIKLERYQQLEDGDPSTNSRLDCDVHVGTHVDAPVHFVPGAASVEQLALETLVGPAVVASLHDVASVTAADLEALDLPSDVRRLLLHTRNSDLWADGVCEFRPDFVALTADAADWVVQREMLLIGVDYLSVQRFRDGPQVHVTLLQAGVVILEGLNLSPAPPGKYELVCLPLKLADADGAPARAILRQLDHGGGP